MSSSVSNSSVASDARLQCVVVTWKNLAKSGADRTEARKCVSELLWIAFPSSSGHELCRKAASALGVHWRTVENWLQCNNDAPGSVVLRILAIAGAEIIFRKIEGVSK